MKVHVLSSFIVLASLAVQSHAALNAYLTIKGQKTGIFTGGVVQKGRDGKIMVIAVDHDITSPRDPQSGLPTGRRRHMPIKMTMEIDRATPLIFNALSTNENLPEVTLDFWSPQNKGGAGVGSEVQHYSIRLTNENISAIHFAMPNNKNPDLMRYTETIEVSFTYQKIEWIWKDGGVMATDSWNN
jgi:type VI secretion system secreted protein Hcp